MKNLRPASCFPHIGLPAQRFAIGLALLYLVLPFSLAWEWRGHQLMLPSEPLLLGLAAYLTWYFPWSQWRTFFTSPLSWWGLAHLLLMGLSTLWSVAPVVSLKYTLIEGLHWFVFYLGTLFVVQNIPATPTGQARPGLVLRLLLGVYLLSFILIMGYAWYRHAAYHFSMDTSVLTARPFYFDHALYGSCAALLLGPAVCFAVDARTRWWRLLYALAVLALAVSLYLSFSRAVWLSLFLAGGLTLIHWWGQPSLRRFLAYSAGGLLLLGLSWPLWQDAILDNKAESKTGTLTEQLYSIANLNTDVSNLERINRYSCAWRMFRDRPLTGSGAGTFPLAYLPYQRPHETTRISVFEPGPHPPGRGGGAHSEYLQALAERGLGGLVIWLGILAAAFTAVTKLARGPRRQLALALFFSLSTLFFHGLFNNFLHDGKLAALFWCLLAGLSALSVSAHID